MHLYYGFHIQSPDKSLKNRVESACNYGLYTMEAKGNSKIDKPEGAKMKSSLGFGQEMGCMNTRFHLSDISRSNGVSRAI